MNGRACRDPGRFPPDAAWAPNATYEDMYKLTYLRGPSGILVMLAQDRKKP